MPREFIHRQRAIRHALLGLLYVHRRAGMTAHERDLYGLVHEPLECTFALDYLTEAGLVWRDSTHFRLTAAGVAQYEHEELHA